MTHKEIFTTLFPFVTVIFSMLAVYVAYTNGMRQAKIAKLEEILSEFFNYKSIYLSLHSNYIIVVNSTSADCAAEQRKTYQLQLEGVKEFAAELKSSGFADNVARVRVLINAYCSDKGDFKKLAIMLNDMVAIMQRVIQTQQNNTSIEYPSKIFDYFEFCEYYKFVESKIIEQMHLGNKPVKIEAMKKFVASKKYEKLK